jgi:phosphate uptake regulator
MMNHIDAIKENLKFQVLEVENVVRLTFRLLSDADIDLLEKIASRDDYVDNLKNIIENQCFSQFHSDACLGENDIKIIRSTHVICVNLERIADFCVSIAQQTEFLIEFSTFHQSSFAEMISLIQATLPAILPALNNCDLSGALDICRCEQQLDDLYKENFDWLMAKMRTGEYIENLITTLFILRYLERIGDSLLNIGEALIFAAIGERIKFGQFDTIQQALGKSGLKTSWTDGNFKSILGSRSGCQIGRVIAKSDDDPATRGIFKEGQKQKIRREKENIERWEKVMPGLVPAILGYDENGTKASLIYRFLPGRTLDSVILSENEHTVHQALELLHTTIRTIWTQTKTVEATPIDYMAQLKERFGTIRRVHPDFFQSPLGIDNMAIPSSENLIRKCRQIEQAHPAPFSVWNHGDFNANNILYDLEGHKIHYIDFYRALEADYVLDASVFIISNFRIPVFEKPLRRRLNMIIQSFYDFVRQFARENSDDTFELRMALALARSLYTSTRFELNPEFARDMFIRAHYLMEKVSDNEEAAETFQLPEDVLFY